MKSGLGSHSRFIFDMRHIRNVATTKMMINDLSHVWDDVVVARFERDRGPDGAALIEGMEYFGVLAPPPSAAWVLLVGVIVFVSTGVIMACVASVSEKKNALGRDESQLQQPQNRVRHKNIPFATSRLQPPDSGAWVPVGSSDKGKDTSTGHCTKSSVALSSGGSVVAAGIRDQGCVRIWQYSPETQGWIQRGQDIPGLEN